MRKFSNLAGIVVLAMLLTGGSVFAASPAGQSVTLEANPLQEPEWQVMASAYGGRLLLSDSPEMVPADGIMYQDVVDGDARLFFHHVNATKQNKRMVVLFQNRGTEPATITVYQKGISGPGHNYLAIGKAVQSEYMKGFDISVLKAPARGGVSLVDEVVQPDMLLNGMYDFKTDKPVMVTVLMMPVDANVKKFAAGARVLPADQYRLRGTFEGRDRLFIPEKVYRPGRDGTVALTLADNHIDRYAWGIDATDGSKVQNYGNYGVVYKLYLPSDKEGKISYYLNPRGGVYAGAMGVKYRHAVLAPVDTPADKLVIGEGTEQEAAFIGTYDAGQSLWLTFSPPGASNLPVKLLLVPEEHK